MRSSRLAAHALKDPSLLLYRICNLKQGIPIHALIRARAAEHPVLVSDVPVCDFWDKGDAPVC